MNNYKKAYLALSFFICMLFAAITVQSASALISAGGYLGYEYSVYKSKISIPDYPKSAYTYSINNLNFGAFFDIKYARIEIGYKTTVGKETEKLKVGDTTDSIHYGVSRSFISANLLGKYPFDLGPVKLWPAIGLGYDINLTNKKTGINVKDQYEINDLFILAGTGMDIKITEKVFFTPSVIFGYNLTPKFEKLDIPGAGYYGWKICANLGVGYSF